MSTPSDLTKQPDEILYDLIVLDNPGTTEHLTLSAYTAGNPAVVTTGDETDPAFLNRKTRLALTAVPGSGYAGSQDIFYNRIHWRDVMHSDDPLTTEFPVTSESITITTETTLTDLIAGINTKYALGLTQDDYVDLPLPEFVDENASGATVRFAAKNTSKIFIGGVLLSIVPDGISLMTALPVNVLSGPIYEVPDDTTARLESTILRMAQPGYW